jgi:hypothetical protein
MSGEDTPIETPARHKNLAPPWQPGQSGNPAGRPKGSRAKLAEDFCKALMEDFAKDGATAIVTMRTEKPNEYARMIASLLPKEVEGPGENGEHLHKIVREFTSGNAQNPDS